MAKQFTFGGYDQQMPCDLRKFQNCPDDRIAIIKYYYTIIASKKIRGNSNYALNLSIHDTKCDFDEPVVVRVSIEDGNDRNGYKIHRDVTIKAKTTEIVSIPIGDLSPEADCKLVVIGITGVTMRHEVELDLQTQTHTILIQTDKAIYKPNDCIKFRVLVLNSELKAATIDQNELIISFDDPCRNIMKKWNGVNTMHGVFSGEFQLSDVPNFGEWKITAAVGDQIKIAVIEVAEYVLPKFEAIIDSSDNFTVEDEKVRAVIRTKYTHGKPLRGLATVIITEDDPNRAFGFFELQSKKKKSNDDDNYLMKKSFNIDGKETIEVDIKKELKFDIKWSDVKNYKIKVEVTEGLTGLTQTADKTIKVHRDTYKITRNLKNRPQRDAPCDIKISVRKNNGTTLTFLDPKKKKIKVFIEHIQIHEFPLNTLWNKNIIESIYELDESGDANFTVDVGKNDIEFSLKVKYCGQETNMGMFHVDTSVTVAPRITLQAKVLTPNCSINKSIEIEVISHYPLPSYTYLIVCHGKILETNTFVSFLADPVDTEYRHRFTIMPTFDYAPQAQIIVYCVRDREIVTSTVTLDLHDDLKNYIELDVANTAKPGEIVDINVKSNPHSYIGLLGIDKSVMILRGGNDLTHDEIWKELKISRSKVKRRRYNSTRHWPHSGALQDFERANLITLTNTIEPTQNIYEYMPMSATVSAGAECYGNFIEKSHMKPIIRNDFPETWVWDSITDKSFNGSLNLKRKVPDSLTTWVLSGFSICPINGLALTKKPSELCVQQPFHVSLNLPFSVKRGEVLTVPCSIFNYLPNQIETEIIFENEHNEFEFVDASVDDKIYPEIRKQTSRKKKLTILSDDAMNAFFTIRPTKVGVISLKVSAISETASDCLIKTLNVECEGVPQFVNKAVFVDLREKSQIEPIDVAIEIPKTALPDSTRIEITCVGDLLGGTIKNLQSLIRMPFGCGEQNMLVLVPNIVVLNYLKNTLQLNAEIEAKAKKYMEIGYQRELSYKHKDGSFSAFGDSDESGSTWLTAFVARSFRQAAEHITIQDDIIDEALKWLSEAQSEDGSFAEKGSICHKEMQAGSSNGVALTAYVLTAFLVNKSSNNNFEKTIEKAIDNIIKSIKNCSDVYALAVSAYALELAGHDSKKDVLVALKQLVKSNENYKWWDKSIEIKDWYRDSKTLSVEITSYALLTLMLNDEDECLPILKWLLTQRNDIGGFEGTQDTIVGIEALAKFASKIATKDTDMKITIEAPNTINFNVNKDNALTLQSQKLAPDADSVRIKASGKGFALLEVGYRYNINTPETVTAFSLKPSVKLLGDDHITLEINTSYNPPKGKDSSKHSN
ncbi:pregnancy zone protein-like, partial [Contarinia nasturtii]|uniref:pregnancy zone protein-like n=1 Tax=Contarinia nasturtii TaxID=265458 RepID=UPI0012D396F0